MPLVDVLILPLKLSSNILHVHVQIIFEPRREKTGFLHMRKQKNRLAVQ